MKRDSETSSNPDTARWLLEMAELEEEAGGFPATTGRLARRRGIEGTPPTSRYWRTIVKSGKSSELDFRGLTQQVAPRVEAVTELAFWMYPEEFRIYVAQATLEHVMEKLRLEAQALTKQAPEESDDSITRFANSIDLRVWDLTRAFFNAIQEVVKGLTLWQRVVFSAWPRWAGHKTVEIVRRKLKITVDAAFELRPTGSKDMG